MRKHMHECIAIGPIYKKIQQISKTNAFTFNVNTSSKYKSRCIARQINPMLHHIHTTIYLFSGRSTPVFSDTSFYNLL
jgi:hypothetical protein